MKLWDTAGQERFHSLVPTYVRGALGVFIVYDVTDQNALEKAEMCESFLSRFEKIAAQYTDSMYQGAR